MVGAVRVGDWAASMEVLAETSGGAAEGGSASGDLTALLRGPLAAQHWRKSTCAYSVSSASVRLARMRAF